MRRFEFVVFGYPRTPKSKSKSAWQRIVREAAEGVWPARQPCLTGELTATIVYFVKDKTVLDVDNIIKPILDALKGLAFEDDNTIFQVTCRKSPLSVGNKMLKAPPLLVEAMARDKDLVFVRIADGPVHEELPE